MSAGLSLRNWYRDMGQVIFGLPILHGYGTLPNLWVSMTDDATLRADVQDLVDADYSNFNFATLTQSVEALALGWTGADAVTPGTRGSYVDAQHLAALEAFMGRSYADLIGQPNPNRDTSFGLEQAWDKLVEALAARLLVQIAAGDAAHPLHDLLAETGYTYSTDTITGDFAAFIDALEAAEPGTAGAKDDYWFDYLPFINAMADSQAVSAEDFSTALQGTHLDDIMPLDLNTYRENFYAGTAGNDNIAVRASSYGVATQFGNSVSDTLLDRAGNDTLSGEDGNDTYIFGSASGNEVIDDNLKIVSVVRIDTVVLTDGILPAHVVLGVSPTDADDLLISIPSLSKTITVRDHYATNLSGERLYYDNIERLVFSDGTIWNRHYMDQLALGQLPPGTQTTLTGTAGDDVIAILPYTGLASGGAGADRFVLDASIVYNPLTITDFNFAEGDRLDVLATETNDDPIDEVSGIAAMQIVETLEGVMIQYTAQRMVFLQGYKAADITVDFFISNTLNYGTGVTLNGTSGADTLTGGNGNDVIYAANGADSIVGGLGKDNLYGESGSDTIWGGYGDDNLDGGSSNDVLWGGEGNDNLTGGVGDDTMTGGKGNDTYTVDSTGDVVTENANEGTDTVYASVSHTLSAHVEKLYLTGSGTINGTGNDAHNAITGNNSNNVLSGGVGNDTLDGANGNDTLIGGIGDDVYYVNTLSDVVTENADEGIDTVHTTVSYSLANHLENLTLIESAALTATGNTLNNYLTGNGNANTLTGDAGNDTLDGASGNDTMIGGTGDDTYYVDAAGDVVTENANEGTDTVFSKVSFTLSADLEHLTLTGYSSVSGTGNAFSNILTGNDGNNTLTGGDGDDTINGGAGADSMIGGAGNDVYYLDSSSDAIVENASEGIDSVYSTRTHTLGTNVEHLTLIGTSTINGTGNALNNQLTGNAMANTLNGQDGSDTITGGLGADNLTGGAGDDFFVFSTFGDSGMGSGNRDVIQDFGGGDKLDVSPC